MTVQLFALVTAQDERVREDREFFNLMKNTVALEDTRRVGRDLDSCSDLTWILIGSVADGGATRRVNLAEDESLLADGNGVPG